MCSWYRHVPLPGVGEDGGPPASPRTDDVLGKALGLGLGSEGFWTPD